VLGKRDKLKLCVPIVSTGNASPTGKGRDDVTSISIPGRLLPAAVCTDALRMLTIRLVSDIGVAFGTVAAPLCSDSAATCTPPGPAGDSVSPTFPNAMSDEAVRSKVNRTPRKRRKLALVKLDKGMRTVWNTKVRPGGNGGCWKSQQAGAQPQPISALPARIVCRRYLPAQSRNRHPPWGPA
jgi:hypothetical protein